MQGLDVTPKEHDELLQQVRTAHRLLAAYYQRLLPSIERIATELDTKYYFWKPDKFNSPSATSNPFIKWKWDLLPAISTLYMFENIDNGKSIKIGDYLVSFSVDSDTSVKVGKTEPDGLELPKSIDTAESLICIGIYTPFTNEQSHWRFDIWEKGAYPDYQDINTPFNCIPDVKGCSIVSCGIKVSISQLMSEKGIEALISRLQELLDDALKTAKDKAEELKAN
ncbi:MAG: DUF883 domain-containing protein [Parashewanella sp.]